ncbi:hypothetical protein [Bradyrhizobium betae]|uniref:Uncharacterized protein n=1 Tax=Bradyrhizobium betae TaxID=244734 RepID=A0A4Q1UT11_9BRAD|nr:hypothetical protein [Bradyrhizobium betae]RXT41805.1 hypothetical protein B5V03_25110 [Bradyrhizobium betae]
MRLISRGAGRPTGLDASSAIRPTPDEVAEFERLDATAPLDETGCPAWSFEGEPLTACERRWLELYRKLENFERLAKTCGRGR